MNSQWVEYTGSDEQIAEIRSSKHGWIARVDIVGVGDSIILDENEPIEDIQIISSYLICNPHPNADMICRWARTGQPVYVKVSGGIVPTNSIFIGDELIIVMPEYFIIKTNKPDWNIPGAEYRLTPF